MQIWLLWYKLISQFKDFKIQSFESSAFFQIQVTGKLNAQKAYMQGKLKIKGNIMLTQKLQGLLKENANL